MNVHEGAAVVDMTLSMWPCLVYAIVVALMAVCMIGLSYILGERHDEPSTGIPYESGMTPTGTARLRFYVDFYLVALFFIIFDIGSVFIVAWAIRAKVLGWTGFISAATFIGVLALALFYLWRAGALYVGPARGEKNDT
jgi:NADH-quinone oxidoreductase subunit A